jgi:hypothetical protein
VLILKRGVAVKAWPPIRPKRDFKKLKGMIAEINHKFIAQAKMLKLFKLIRILCNNRYTIKEMADQLDTSERTIYRHISLLEFMDISLDKDFDDKYFIVQGCCPLCGITTNNHL